MIRVRFAPSPTGYLHIGSARTFIFNWLYARRHGGTMILRIDDTDVERNTEESLHSIFDGLKWLGLGWDEEYRQSERLALHRELAEAILAKGLAYRDFTPAEMEDAEKTHAGGAWLFNPGQAGDIAGRKRPSGVSGREIRCCGSACRARSARPLRFQDCVYGEQAREVAWTLRISRCCAAMARRRIIWRPAPTMPICASAILCAGRII
jgi:glutamyl/glutaminyl-tRNA synthetase